MTAARQIVQARLPLSLLRLSTPAETQTTLALAGHERLIGLLETMLNVRGVGGEKVMLLCGFTGRAAATGEAAPTAPVAQATLPPPVAATSTPVPPTPRPTEPLAAQVNGQPITLAEFERELARFAAVQPPDAAPAAGAHAQGLDALIARAPILHAAAAAGVWGRGAAQARNLSLIPIWRCRRAL